MERNKGDKIYDRNTTTQLVRAVTERGVDSLVRFGKHIFYVAHREGSSPKILAAYDSSDSQYRIFNNELAEARL
jgi:hypothetical protein